MMMMMMMMMENPGAGGILYGEFCRMPLGK
jgi:hypothetical protein